MTISIDEAINELKCLLARQTPVNNMACCDAIQMGTGALEQVKREREMGSS